jgi:polysaccharide biosynthesis PFTS motif protein
MWFNKKTLSDKQAIYKKAIERHDLSKVRQIRNQMVLADLNKLREKFVNVRLHESREFQLSLGYFQQRYTFVWTEEFMINLLQTLQTGKKLSAAIPKDWFAIFQVNEISINRLWSRIFWIAAQIRWILRSLIKSFIVALFVAFRRDLDDSSLDLPSKHLIYLHRFTEDSIPPIFPMRITFTLLDWLQKNMLVPKIGTEFFFLHSVKNKTNNLKNGNMSSMIYWPIPVINTSIKVRTLIFPILVKLLLESSNLLRGKSRQQMLLIDELLVAEVHKLQKTSDLLDAYVFTRSVGIKRPLWTYRVEELGKDVIYVNYSASDMPRIEMDNFSRQEEFQLSSWSRMNVIDQIQQNFYKTFSQEFLTIETVITGVPWLEDSGETISLPDSFILLFDYENPNNHFGFSTANDCGYSDGVVNVRFLDIVFEALQAVAKVNGAEVVVVKKFKRELNLNIRWPIIKESENERKTPAGLVYLPLRGNFPVEILLQNATAVISLPITTPGIAAKLSGIPSCYLDPLGKVDKTDFSLRNIPLFTLSRELVDWLVIHLPNKKESRSDFAS